MVASRLNSLALGRVLVLLAVLGFLSSACDPGEAFTYENATGEPLFVQVNDGAISRLPPRETSKIGYIYSRFGDDDDPLKIVVADARGCIVLKLETTLQRFEEEQDSTLNIVASELLPADQRTQCDPDLAN